MSINEVIAKIYEQFGGAIQILVEPSGADSLKMLLDNALDVVCNATVFQAEICEISQNEACILLVSTLNRSLAYSSFEYMSLDESRYLAKELINSLDADTRYFSTTCIPENDEKSISAWYFIASNSTFESVLYCQGKNTSVLFVVTDED
jgi:hypothetical protein